MGRRPTRRQTDTGFPFAFLGFRDGWYVLRADIPRTRPSNSIAALAFEGRVSNWLITHRITPGTWSHFGSGNTGEYPFIPELAEDEHALHLLLKRGPDVLRLANVFPCTGITPASFMAASQAEAAVHIYIIDDIAILAYEAARNLLALSGEALPAWSDLNGETRVMLVIQVREHLERPSETVEDIHARYVDQRLRADFRFGVRLDERAKTDPLLLPWNQLRPITQARYRQWIGIVEALGPLLKS
jgi:hypothetical protein